MKRTLILGVAIMALMSCKKTWQCECRDVQNWEDWKPVITNVAIEDEKKDDAKTICSSLGYDMGNGTYKTCSIKE